MQRFGDIIIRALEDDDVAKVQPYFDNLSPATRSKYHPYKFTADDIATIARQLHADTSAHVGAFCDDGGGERMVGHVWYSHEGGYGNPGLGIGIVDDFQGRGIGQRLMSEIDAVARKRGERRIELSWYSDNLQALRVYSKAGYRIVSRAREGGQICMVREFADAVLIPSCGIRTS